MKRPFNLLKYLIFLISLLFIIKLNPLTRVRNIAHDISRRTRFSEHWLRNDFSSCSPVKNIAYLKAHKTASSAIQNILFRFGIKHQLHFALPKEGNYFGKDAPFNAEMIPVEIKGNSPINIFAIHTKWHYHEIKSVMPKDTIYIASIREPLSLFESLYTYALRKKTGLSFEDYVLSTPANANRVKNYLGFNQLVYDFGLPEEELTNETAVRNLINVADNFFDLVLSAENMEESLILLRHLLCWSYEDIAVLKINTRTKKYKTQQIRDKVRDTLQERLSSDILLYSHFQNKIEKLIDEFGEEEMEREKEEYRKVKRGIEEKCDIKEETKDKLIEGLNRPYSHMVNGFAGNLLDSNCRNFIISENAMIEGVRRNQEIKVRKALGLHGLLRYSLPKGAIPLGNSNMKSKLNKTFVL